MLVLTRRSTQKVIFPTVGISLEVLRIKGNVVKLGIEAPADVKILREEVQQSPGEAEATTPEKNPQRAWRHALFNRLNSMKVALFLLSKQLEAGKVDDTEKTLKKLLEEFNRLESELTQKKSNDAKSATAPRKYRALLVEDDTNESELLAGFLRLSGFEVSTADDGEDALEYLDKNECPDLVLLDMMMPRCNGAETLGRIRENPKLESLKVFAVSASSPTEYGVVTGPAGFDRWFPKPLNPEKLVSQIHQEFQAL